MRPFAVSTAVTYYAVRTVRGKRHKTVECPFVELRPVGPILEGTHVESPRDQLLSARGNVSSLTQPLLLLNVLTAKLQ